MKSFGITMESRLIWYEGDNLPFIILLSVLFLGMILGGFLYGGNMAFLRYQQILRSYGLGGTDYYKEWGAPATMINMGINGMTAMGFLIATGVHLNGPTIGGIFTIVGFSATGKHLRNILPVMTGVVFASAGKVWSITDPSASLRFCSQRRWHRSPESSASLRGFSRASFTPLWRSTLESCTVE